MKILVTGASGHVGGAITIALCAAGHDVVATGRRPSADHLPCTYLSSDLSKTHALERLDQVTPACDAIVHAGACLSKDPFDPRVLAVNIDGTQRLVELAAKWKSTRLIFISGVTVIGRPVELPITEDHPQQPETVYQFSKMAGEHLVRLSAGHGVIGTTLRLPSPIGPGMPMGRILSVFVQKALRGEPLTLLGEGSRRQNYLDVRDVAPVVERCLADAHPGTFNVASPTTCSNLKLATLCVARTNSNSRIEFADQPDPEEGMTWEVSIERAERELAFDPAFRLGTSIHDVAQEMETRNDRY
jgi:UDP-glucose 4-epimerase